MSVAVAQATKKHNTSGLSQHQKPRHSGWEAGIQSHGWFVPRVLKLKQALTSTSM